MTEDNLTAEAERLAESWLNGNHGHVARQIQEAGPRESIALTALIVQQIAFQRADAAEVIAGFVTRMVLEAVTT